MLARLSHSCTRLEVRIAASVAGTATGTTTCVRRSPSVHCQPPGPTSPHLKRLLNGKAGWCRACMSANSAQGPSDSILSSLYIKRSLSGKKLATQYVPKPGTSSKVTICWAQCKCSGNRGHQLPVRDTQHFQPHSRLALCSLALSQPARCPPHAAASWRRTPCSGRHAVSSPLPQPLSGRRSVAQAAIQSITSSLTHNLT